MMNIERDVMSYDVLIVGAGPAGLSAAIRLKQLSEDINVCVLEKASEIGSQIISGAVFDPIALDELIPDWQSKGAPLNTVVSIDDYLYLSENKSFRLPDFLIPPLMRNQGNYIGSLSELCKWLAEQAEVLGVEIYPGFAAQEPLYDLNGKMIGIITGDMGRNKTGDLTPQFTPGIEIRAAYTLIAEGARGSISKMVQKNFNLRSKSSYEKYGLGIKEVWRIPKEKHKKGIVQHTTGWPLGAGTNGGGFVYHYGEDLVSIGLVVHLDYQNPYVSPFDEFQKFKTHPDIKTLLQDAKRQSYGARAISEGGVQSLPELTFPGGAFIGCSAGMVNIPRIKGSHNAIKSGMLAAEAVFNACSISKDINEQLSAYPQAIKESWLWKDLYSVRNFKPLISLLGVVGGASVASLELWLASYNIYMPWTLTHKKPDHKSLRPINRMKRPDYPKPDGILTFDKLSSVQLSNINHNSDQPNHLKLSDINIPITVNLALYDAPEQRYCPAGVYEIIEQDQHAALQINSQNCIHCKTCDIKDPLQNINWVPPEGGSGPIYKGM